MGHRGSLVSLALAASVIGALSGVGLGHASGVTSCGDTRGSLGASTAVSLGLGLPAVVGGGTLVDVAPDHRRLVDTSFAGSGVIRHVGARPGKGTAFVLDRRGADQVVVVTPARTIRLEQPGEAAHPSWSADGRLVWSLGSRLRVWSAGAASYDIAPPTGALDVFSPVFVGTDAIVAVVAEPEAGVTRSEDEGVDNLWRYDIAARRWHRLTSFQARGDRWVGVRTPIARSDGSVEFVRVSGVGSRTGMPSFSLFRLTADRRTIEVRDLPREMYLAGILGDERVWNIFDQSSGEWRLYEETSATSLVDLGCGAVTVDPRSVDDPDRTPARPMSTATPTVTATPTSSPVPSSTSTPTVTSSPTPTATASPVPSATPTPTASPTVTPLPTDGHLAGILVGDFPTLEAATQAAAGINAAFGEASIVEVVDSAVAPNIVRPGVWAAVMLVPEGDDPFAALTDLRSRLPEYQGWSWVVSV